jgi:hypothetical protein
MVFILTYLQYTRNRYEAIITQLAKVACSIAVPVSLCLKTVFFNPSIFSGNWSSLFDRRAKLVLPLPAGTYGSYISAPNLSIYQRGCMRN